MADRTKIVFCKGVEGPSLYLNDYRIAGPKPWGGGHVEREWQVEWRDVISAAKGRGLIGAAGTAASEVAEMGYDPIEAVRALPELLGALQAIAAFVDRSDLDDLDFGRGFGAEDENLLRPMYQALARASGKEGE